MLRVRSVIKSGAVGMAAAMFYIVSATVYTTNLASPWWFPMLMASLAAATLDSITRAMRLRPPRRRRRVGIWHLLVRSRFLTWGSHKGFSWTVEYKARR